MFGHTLTHQGLRSFLTRCTVYYPGFKALPNTSCPYIRSIHAAVAILVSDPNETKEGWVNFPLLFKLAFVASRCQPHILCALPIRWREHGTKIEKWVVFACFIKMIGFRIFFWNERGFASYTICIEHGTKLRNELSSHALPTWSGFAYFTEAREAAHPILFALWNQSLYHYFLGCMPYFESFHQGLVCDSFISNP